MKPATSKDQEANKLHTISNTENKRMTSAFLSFTAARRLTGLSSFHSLRCSSTSPPALAFSSFVPSTPIQSTSSHLRLQKSVRMQCTPTGEVPDMNETVVGNMERKITDALTPKRLSVIPTLGDPNGAHVQIEVVSDQFEGMSPVKRHQAVYKAIWEELDGPVHAVDKLVTKTPSEDSS